MSDLYDAAAEGNVDRADELLTQGEDINQRYRTNGCPPGGPGLPDATPLMWAATHGQVATVALLLEKSATINFQNNVGWTALMNAAFNGDNAQVLEVVQLLLAHNADASLTNNDGKTALELAQERNQTKTIALLEAAMPTAIISMAPHTGTSTPPLVTSKISDMPDFGSDSDSSGGESGSSNHDVVGTHAVHDRQVQAQAAFRFGCDGCHENIFERRFHCCNCPDFDYCYVCYQAHRRRVCLVMGSESSHDPSHRFEEYQVAETKPLVHVRNESDKPVRLSYDSANLYNASGLLNQPTGLGKLQVNLTDSNSDSEFRTTGKLGRACPTSFRKSETEHSNSRLLPHTSSSQRESSDLVSNERLKSVAIDLLRDGRRSAFWAALASAIDLVTDCITTKQLYDNDITDLFAASIVSVLLPGVAFFILVFGRILLQCNMKFRQRYCMVCGCCLPCVLPPIAVLMPIVLIFDELFHALKGGACFCVDPLENELESELEDLLEQGRDGIENSGDSGTQSIGSVRQPAHACIAVFEDVTQLIINLILLAREPGDFAVFNGISMFVSICNAMVSFPDVVHYAKILAETEPNLEDY